MKQFKVQSKKARSKERGAALVLVTVFLVALFGFAALSIDVGNVLVQRARLQEAGDSAALAAVLDWGQKAAASVVNQRAKDFDSANGVLATEVVSVRVGKWDQTSRTFTPKDPLASTDVPAVEVTNQRVVPMAFAKVVGMDSMSPKTLSVAVVAQADAAGGVLPWAVCDDLGVTPGKCVQVTLKNDPNCGGPGNFGALALGGSGASNYKGNIETGYQGVLRVGDLVSTEPGNMVGPTSKGLQDRLQGVPPYTCTASSLPPNNARLAIIPVVDSLAVNGRSQVKITAFWVFALIDSGNGGEVTAQFLDVFNGTEVDPSKPPTTGTLGAAALVK